MFLFGYNSNKLTEEQQFFLDVVSGLWSTALVESVRKFLYYKNKGPNFFDVAFSGGGTTTTTIEKKSNYSFSEEMIYKEYIKIMDKMISRIKRGKSAGYYSFQKKGKFIKLNSDAVVAFLEFAKEKSNLSDKTYSSNVENELASYYFFYSKRSIYSNTSIQRNGSSTTYTQVKSNGFNSFDLFGVNESGKERARKMFDMFKNKYQLKIKMLKK